MVLYVLKEGRKINGKKFKGYIKTKQREDVVENRDRPYLERLRHIQTNKITFCLGVDFILAACEDRTNDSLFNQTPKRQPKRFIGLHSATDRYHE